MKNSFKKTLIFFINLSFVKILFKVFYFFYYFLHNHKNRCTIFVFHDVNSNVTQFSQQFNLNINPHSFKIQIDRINKKYNIIHPNDLLKKNKLPPNSALITFDDGFKTAFENGIEYLISKNIPCIMFLNMNHIINNTPLISSTICYLSKFSNIFIEKMNHNNIKPPFFLNLNQNLFKQIISSIPEYNIDNINEYQGRLANYETILKYSNNKFVSYGNHLYEHWNSLVLSDVEFQYMINENNKALANFSNYINYFAFPNGQPITCFNDSHVNQLQKSGFLKIFYSSCGISANYCSRILDRVILTEKETTKFNFYSIIGRSLIFNNNVNYNNK